jgi:hypothetical protein
LKEFKTIGGKLLHGRLICNNCGPLIPSVQILYSLHFLVLATRFIISLLICSWILAESFRGINDDTLLSSLGQLNEVNSVDVVNFCLPNLPAPPNAFRGIRRKSSSLRRWLAICTDDITELVNWVRCFIIYIYIYI